MEHTLATAMSFRGLSIKSNVMVVICLTTFVGCDHSDRVAKLEKQVSEIQSDRERVADFDLQAKCAKDAKQWFQENWLPRDKDTVLLDFSDHYNKKQNKCFVLVERHYNSNLAGPGGSSWTNHMTLYDVYENSEYGEFAENHYTYFRPKITTGDEVITCKVYGQDCKTLDQFDGLVRDYLKD